MHLDKLNPTLTQAKPTLEEDNLREPTKEEIMEDIRIGIIQAKAGLGRPALEVLDEIDRELRQDANSH